jgi:ribonuclease VapC
MIIDTSVIAAIILQEPEAQEFSQILDTQVSCKMIAPNYLELCMALLGNKNPSGRYKIDFIIDEFDVKIIPFTPEMASAAAVAFLKYGKGQGNKAQLNFGDCMAYAASKVEGLPLLFKGDHFSKTDVERVI